MLTVLDICMLVKNNCTYITGSQIRPPVMQDRTIWQSCFNNLGQLSIHHCGTSCTDTFYNRISKTWPTSPAILLMHGIPCAVCQNFIATIQYWSLFLSQLCNCLFNLLFHPNIILVTKCDKICITLFEQFKKTPGNTTIFFQINMNI